MLFRDTKAERIRIGHVVVHYFTKKKKNMLQLKAEKETEYFCPWYRG